ncbi:predicted protein, partial [Nematostella vectensis]
AHCVYGGVCTVRAVCMVESVHGALCVWWSLYSAHCVYGGVCTVRTVCMVESVQCALCDGGVCT